MMPGTAAGTPEMLPANWYPAPWPGQRAASGAPDGVDTRPTGAFQDSQTSTAITRNSTPDRDAEHLVAVDRGESRR